MKKRNSIIVSFVFAGTLALGSCKVTQETLKTDILIPDQYVSNASKSPVNEVRKDSISLVENRKDFFSDSSLTQLIDDALVRNFDMQIAFQKLMQTKAGVQYTRGIRLPEVGLNLAAGQRKFGDYTIDGVGNYDTQFSTNLNDKQQIPNPVPDFYAGIYSTWEIDLWGRLKNKKRAALARFLAQEQGKNLVATQLISEIAETYYRLVILDKQLVIIEENIRLQENALQIVAAQKESGKSNELAIELLSAQVLNARTLMIDVQQSIISAENKLNFLAGRYPQPVTRSGFEASKEISKIPETGVPSDMLENRPDIKAASYELLAQNADVRSAKAAFYPNLTISGNVGYQAFRAALLLEPVSLAYSVAGGLVTPLLNRRTLKADLMLSRATQKGAYVNYEKTIVQAFTEVYELMQLLGNYQTMQNLKQEEVDILEKSIGTSKSLFASGRANYLEIITSQEKYLRAQIELLDIHYRRTINNIHLYKALGGGWKQGLD